MRNIEKPRRESSVDAIQNAMLNTIFPVWLGFRVLAHHFVLEQIDTRNMTIGELSGFATLIKKNRDSFAKQKPGLPNPWDDVLLEIGQRLLALEDAQYGSDPSNLSDGISDDDSGDGDRKSTRLNSSHSGESRMPSSA